MEGVVNPTAVNPVYRRRLLGHRVGIALSVLAMVVGLGFLAWILFTLLVHGFGALSHTLFALDTPAPGSEGGIRNAIVGSLLMVGFSTAVSTPIGILAGMYLAEYGQNNRFAAVTRFVTDIMLSAPSIVIGLFVYAVVVAYFKTFSGLAGALALALIVIPVVIRTTENMLQLVPPGLREAAYALGTPKWKVIMSITLRAARAGVVTGILLAVARIAGETAPLLFTALNNQFWTADVSQPMASLPVTIFKFAMSPYENWQKLAWAGVFLITAAVLGLNILARVLTRSKH